MQLFFLCGVVYCLCLFYTSDEDEGRKTNKNCPFFTPKKQNFEYVFSYFPETLNKFYSYEWHPIIFVFVAAFFLFFMQLLLLAFMLQRIGNVFITKGPRVDQTKPRKRRRWGFDDDDDVAADDSIEVVCVVAGVFFFGRFKGKTKQLA